MDISSAKVTRRTAPIGYVHKNKTLLAGKSGAYELCEQHAFMALELSVKSGLLAVTNGQFSVTIGHLAVTNGHYASASY